jgi:hypothetical protein
LPFFVSQPPGNILVTGLMSHWTGVARSYHGSTPRKKRQFPTLDAALLSRFVKAKLQPKRPDWLHWARDNGGHPDVIASVESDPAIFKSPLSSESP